MQNTIKQIQSALTALYSDNELQSIVRLLISNVTGFNFTEILVNKNTIFSPYQRDLFNIYIEKLKTGMPVQYVLGETVFCGLNFKVDKSVLIPRPETEEMVEWIVNDVAVDSVMLDIGTGSGCIAIALKHFMPKAKVYGCDVDPDCLETARINARLNSLQIDFFQTDILKVSNITGRYHVIVSNPPYIPYAERILISDHVKNFEPEKALFVPDNDPLIFYRKIARFAKDHLYSGGKLFFEVHRDYGKACVSLLTEMNFCQVEMRMDIAGNNRMIRALIS